MKTRIISLFTVLMLIAAMFTTSVYAVEGITVTVPETYIGDNISVKGTVDSSTGLSELIIKILDSNGKMFYYNSVFVKDFTTNGISIPTVKDITITPEGTYKIKVGYGEISTESTFVMKKKSSGSSPTSDGSKYYGGNNSSGTTTTTTPSATPTPTTEPTTTPIPTTDPTASPIPTDKPDSTPSQSGFEDMHGNEWANEAVDALVKAKIINGTSDKSYEPDRSITRAEFCKLVVSAFNLDNEDDSKNYGDVRSDEWYFGFVMKAAKAGVVTGYDEGSFKPNDSITREEMAAMIVRAFKAAGVEVPESDVTFADKDEIGSWASQYVSGLAKMGIVSGRGDNRFVPKDNLTRAESAKVIYSALNILTALSDKAE